MGTQLRVLVCGSRHFNDIVKMRTVLKEIDEEFSITDIIHGNAKGADIMAAGWGHLNGKIVHTFPAQWSVYDKAAGPIRNKQMLDEGKPDLVVAFLAPNSRGTKNMIEQAEKAGVPVKIINIGE
jgi:SLOG family YspA-like protein